MAFGQKIKKGFGSTFSFFKESFEELKKVRWPHRNELVSYTLVVIFAVVLVTVYFWVVDIGLSALVSWIYE